MSEIKTAKLCGDNIVCGRIKEYTIEDAIERCIASQSLDPIESEYASITDSYEFRPRRLICEYCGCISGKDHGTCEHCGAPLREKGKGRC